MALKNSVQTVPFHNFTSFCVVHILSHRNRPSCYRPQCHWTGTFAVVNSAHHNVFFEKGYKDFAQAEIIAVCRYCGVEEPEGFHEGLARRLETGPVEVMMEPAKAVEVGRRLVVCDLFQVGFYEACAILITRATKTKTNGKKAIISSFPPHYKCTHTSTQVVDSANSVEELLTQIAGNEDFQVKVHSSALITVHAWGRKLSKKTKGASVKAVFEALRQRADTVEEGAISREQSRGERPQTTSDQVQLAWLMEFDPSQKDANGSPGVLKRCFFGKQVWLCVTFATAIYRWLGEGFSKIIKQSLR